MKGGFGEPAPDAKEADPADLLHYWWNRDGDHTENLTHIWKLGVPVIAAVRGYCMGGGFWYSLACDITIASEDAVFGQPEVRHASNTTFMLAALTNWKQAHRWALTGDHLDAEEALRIGIINKIVPNDKLKEEAWSLAERIAKVPEASVRVNKAITWMGLEAMGLGAGMKVNGALSSIAHSSRGKDVEALGEARAQGGLRAFLEARDGPFMPEPFGPKSRAR